MKLCLRRSVLTVVILWGNKPGFAFTNKPYSCKAIWIFVNQHNTDKYDSTESGKSLLFCIAAFNSLPGNVFYTLHH